MTHQKTTLKRFIAAAGIPSAPVDAISRFYKQLGLGLVLGKDGAPEEITGLGNDPEKALNLINKVLAFQRQYAQDHETGLNPKPEGTSFQGAALVQARGLDAQGHEVTRYFINSNIHLTNNQTGRQCAEERATASAKSRLINAAVEQIWFMGGESKLSHTVHTSPRQIRKNILKNEWLKYYSPCGSCRDVISAYGNPETLVHILPLNDGRVHLVPDALPADMPHGPNNDAEKPTVWTQKAKLMLPLQEIRAEYSGAASDLKKTWTALKTRSNKQVPIDAKHYGKTPFIKLMGKDAVNTAINAALRAHAKPGEVKHRTMDLEKALDALESAPESQLGAENKRIAIQHVIHRFMMEYASFQCNRRDPDTIENLTIAVVRIVDEDGKPRYHVGEFLEAKGVQANSPAIRKVVDDVIPTEIVATATDVFYMQIEPSVIKDTIRNDTAPRVIGPDGDQLDTFLKASKRNISRPNGVEVRNFDGKVMAAHDDVASRDDPEKGQPMVHVFMPCAPHVFNTQKHVFHNSVHDMMPFGFAGRPNHAHSPACNHR